MVARATRSSRRPVVRKMDFDFSNLGRWWMADNPVLSHALNGINLLFPEGERFFMRSVRHYLPQVRDPELKARVSAFFGQEARHGFEHEAATAVLEAQGYEVASFLEWYEHVAYEVIEANAPPSLRLSVTVALEHLTAVMAHRALTRDTLDHAEPIMQELLRWHACEEIEHKSVAFDVFDEVDGRYRVRLVGGLMAYALLMGFWIPATRHLLDQEGLSAEDRARYRAEATEIAGDRRYLVRALLDYLRPGFHPDQIDDYDLAVQWLAARDRLDH